MNKRLLCLMASLLLCGAVSAQHFTAPDAHAKSGNTPIVAAVTVDNAAPADGAELAVFVGEGENEELRGLATTTLNGNFWVQAFYNSGTTETLTFKLWDPTGEGTELDTYTLTYGELTALTTCEEGHGTPGNPVQIAFTTTQTQTTTLAQGWTWWSTPIELSTINGLTMLESCLGHNGITIKSDNATTMNYYEYYGSDYWYGSLEDIGLSNEVGYKINTTSACDVNMRGVYANPQQHPITIKPNWNWIGYPVNSTQSVTTALANYTPENEDVIKGEGWTSTYYSGYGWFPVYDMTPGHSYLYKSKASDNKILTFSNSRGEKLTEQPHHYWNADRHAFADNCSVFAVVSLDGSETNDDGFEIGAFVNGECRGSSRLLYFAPLNRYFAILTISGENGELVDFGLINHNNSSVENSRSNEIITFTSDVVIGTLDNPYRISFGNNQQTETFAIFPNPIEKNQPFKLSLPIDEQVKEVVIMNSLGSVIYHEEGAIKDNLRGFSASGVYTVKVTCRSGNTYIGRIIVK